MAKTRDNMNFSVGVLDDTQKGLRKILQGAGSFGKSLTRTLTAPFKLAFSPATMAGVFNIKALLSSLERLHEAADQQRIAEAKLGATLRATGHAAGLTASQIKKYAAERQKVTTFGDEETINAAAIMATFRNIRGKEFFDAMSAVQDLSAAFGQDLRAGVIQLGKALNDPIMGITALNRVGVTFSEQQREQIHNFIQANRVIDAQRVMLDELKNQVGGTAEALAGGGGGALKQLRNQLGDLVEDFAAILDPMTVGLTKAISFQIGSMQSGLVDFKEFARVNMNELVSMFTTGFGSLGDVFSSNLKAGWKTFLGSISAGDLSAKLSTIASKIPIYIGKAMLEVRRTFATFTKAFLEGIGDFTIFFGRGVAEIVKYLGGPSGMLGAKGIANDFADIGVKIRESGMRAWFAMRVTQKESEKLDEALEKVDRQAEKLTRTFTTGRWGDAIRDAFEAMSLRARGFFTNLNPAQKFKQLGAAAAEASKKAQEAADKMWSAYERAANAVKSAKNALDQARQAKWGTKAQEMQEDLQLQLARAGSNEWLQQEIRFRAARKAFGLSRGFAADPAIQQQFEDFALGLLNEMRTNQLNLWGPGAKQVNELFERVRGQRRGRAEGDLAEAQKALAMKEQEELIARQRWIAEQKAIATKEQETQAAQKATRQLVDLAEKAGTAGKALLRMLPAMPVPGNNPALGLGLDALSLRLGG